MKSKLLSSQPISKMDQAINKIVLQWKICLAMTWKTNRNPNRNNWKENLELIIWNGVTAMFQIQINQTLYLPSTKKNQLGTVSRQFFSVRTSCFFVWVCLASTFWLRACSTGSLTICKQSSKLISPKFTISIPFLVQQPLWVESLSEAFISIILEDTIHPSHSFTLLSSRLHLQFFRFQ